MALSAEPSAAPSGDLTTASSGDAAVQPAAEGVQVDQLDASAAWQRTPVHASAIDPLMAVLGRPAPSGGPGDASSPLDDRLGDLLDTLLDDLLPAALPAR